MACATCSIGKRLYTIHDTLRIRCLPKIVEKVDSYSHIPICVPLCGARRSHTVAHVVCFAQQDDLYLKWSEFLYKLIKAIAHFSFTKTGH